MTKTITINIKEETDEKFRKVASKAYGNKKGHLSKAVEEALEEWINEKEATNAVDAALQLLKTGIKTNKKWKFDRDELYADRIPG